MALTLCKTTVYHRREDQSTKANFWEKFLDFLVFKLKPVTSQSKVLFILLDGLLTQEGLYYKD